MHPPTVVKHGLLSGILTWSVARSYTLMSSAGALPPSISWAGAPDDSDVITLHVELMPQNLDRLADELYAVSHPDSPRYGYYLDRHGVNNMFAPSDRSRDAIMAWLEEWDANGVDDFGSHISFTTTVSNANLMLNSSFQNYVVDGVPKLRTREYYLRDDLAQHVQLISPTTFFSNAKASAPVNTLLMPLPSLIHGRQSLNASNTTWVNGTVADMPRPADDCSAVIRPSCLERLYDYSKYSEDAASSGSRLAFITYGGTGSTGSDLDLFQKVNRLPPSNISVVSLGEGKGTVNGRSMASAEANLDSQVMSAVAGTLPITEYIIHGADDFLNLLHFLLEVPDIPQVISFSYGWYESTTVAGHASRVCDMIGMLALRGVTFVAASGDSGAGLPCQAEDGKAWFGPMSMPATCPYLTSVGGTQGFAPEAAWPPSSGGFSSHFARPSYQESAVTNYLTENILSDTLAYYSHFVDFQGRGLPDISAHAKTYQVFIDGNAVTVDGTSASAPLVAGLIGLLNDARLRRGEPAMGFINPWLYSDGVWAEVLTDVAEGRSGGCYGNGVQENGEVAPGTIIPWAHWNATAGWDPVTGLGVPKFAAMLEAALRLKARTGERGERGERA